MHRYLIFLKNTRDYFTIRNAHETQRFIIYEHSVYRWSDDTVWILRILFHSIQMHHVLYSCISIRWRRKQCVIVISFSTLCWTFVLYAAIINIAMAIKNNAIKKILDCCVVNLSTKVVSKQCIWLNKCLCCQNKANKGALNSWSS